MTRVIAAIWLCGLACMSMAGADWPTYLGDDKRCGVAPEPVASKGQPAWVYEAAQPPAPAFYPRLKAETLGPQKFLAYASPQDLAFAPVIADGHVYFGSSSENTLTCLDLGDGHLVWRRATGGAIRLAPTVWNGRVLVGSDDGHVYCFDAARGDLVWRFTPATNLRWIMANGRPAAQCPVRTSVTIADGTAYFAAGLFPESGGVTLCAVDAATGKPAWQQPILLPPQGYILVEGDTLIVPNGRASPAEYRRADGRPLVDLSDLRREGGGSIVSTFGDMLVYGPSEFGILRFRADKAEPAQRNYSSALTRALHGKITGIAGQRVVAAGKTALLLRDDELIALDDAAFRTTLRTSAEEYPERVKNRVITEKSSVQMATDTQAEKEMSGYTRWSVKLPGARALMVAGDLALVGGNGVVAAFDLASGKERFRVPVDGTAWELASAGGTLVAATDRGRLYGIHDMPAAAVTTRHAAPAAPATIASPLATAALAATDRRRGVCVVLGAADGALPRALAAGSEFSIVCAERDPARADALRETLLAAGLYGSRIVVNVHADGALPYAPYMANLVVSADADGGGFAAARVRPLLQPGGTLVLPAMDRTAAAAWTASFPELGAPAASAAPLTARRGPLAGAGAWTHMFADSANTDCSGDTLVGGTTYNLQWFGDPGPSTAVGWHANGMGPLQADGRLYLVKADYVETVDAYNGTSLWRRDVPGSARFSPAREGGSACVKGDRFYIAVSNNCLVLDAVTGRDVASLTGPGPDGDWGYLAVEDDLLLGTRQSPRATTNPAARDKTVNTFKAMWGTSEVSLVLSRLLFALQRGSGEPAWTYGDDARAVVNATITIGGGRVYFVESRRAAAIADEDGSLLLRDFIDDAWLVALDLATGRKLWEAPLAFPSRTMLYLSYVDGRLVASGGDHEGPLAHLSPSQEATTSLLQALPGDFKTNQQQMRATNIRFLFKTFDAATGAEGWSSSYLSTVGIGHQHNYNNNHPVITAKAIWHAPAEQTPVRIDMADGKVKTYTGRRGKGCATPTASARGMFYRSTAIAGFDFATEEPFYVSRVNRPSCWLSILPAGGLLLMPEYSIGCNCAFPIQTSAALLPVSPEEAVGNRDASRIDRATGGGRARNDGD